LKQKKFELSEKYKKYNNWEALYYISLIIWKLFFKIKQFFKNRILVLKLYVSFFFLCDVWLEIVHPFSDTHKYIYAYESANFFKLCQQEMSSTIRNVEYDKVAKIRKLGLVNPSWNGQKSHFRGNLNSPSIKITAN